MAKTGTIKPNRVKITDSAASRVNSGRTTPPQQVNKRSRPIAGAERSSQGFPTMGDNLYKYGELPPLRKNNAVETYHQYGPGWKHSFLAVGNGKGDIVPTSRFEFWTEEVKFGYGSSGSQQQSKYYSAYYAKAFSMLPISITGRVPTEKYKEELQSWIRASQINLARGEPRVRLVIPSANIAVWGFIPSFAGGQESGFEPAPPIKFDFIVTRDRRKVDKPAEVSQMVIAYFLDPQDKYWKKKSQIFMDTLYDDLESEINKEATRNAHLETLTESSQPFKDFFRF